MLYQWFYRFARANTARQVIDRGARARCALDEVLKREKRRQVHIGGVPVWLRTATPDIDVAASSLLHREYETVRCDEARVIVDAGANIGTSSIYFARRFPEAKILAIEPETSNFELLVENVAPYPNVVPVKAAIWGGDGEREVQNRHTGHWGYTVAETSNRTSGTGQVIDCVSMPSLMAAHGIEHIDILKMDIEGGEKDVLENSAEWIDAVSILVVELHDRICMGCDRAFYLASQDFEVFEKHGEKVTAYRRRPHAVGAD